MRSSTGFGFRALHFVAQNGRVVFGGFLIAVLIVALAPTSGWSADWRSDIMSVSGIQLLRNGNPFEVHGVEISAFETPADWFENAWESPNAFLRAAYKHY